jgi:hypothetical protein
LQRRWTLLRVALGTVVLLITCSQDTEEHAMPTTPPRTGARNHVRRLVTVSFAAAAVAAGATPAAAAPEEGTPLAPIQCAAQWGWPNGATEPAYPGQRFGVHLAPQCRGPVLEGLDD